jgi:hypothetical protein
MLEMKGRTLGNSRIQTDYASPECKYEFFEDLKKSGLDDRRRSQHGTNSSTANCDSSPR